MPSEMTLNAKNLAALGAERLAELLLDVTAGDAAAKRRLRLELASRAGGDVAGEIRKRFLSIARSRSFVDWRKVKELARDLEMQREAIAAHVAATSPGEAFDLLWRMLEMAPSIYERCDDSNGAIGSVIASARDDLGAIAVEAGQPVGALANYSIVTLLPVDLVLGVGSAAGYAMIFALLIAALVWKLGTLWLGLPN